MSQWKWYVYILECQDGFYYTGMTWNLEERMLQHSSGKGSAFTAKHGVKALRYTEEFNNIHDARKREVHLKDFSRKKKEALWANSSQAAPSNNNMRGGKSSSRFMVRAEREL